MNFSGRRIKKIMSVFSSRSFLYPKDPENPQQNQDAFQVDEMRGTAVVADGVSSAIFSAAWAKILTQHTVKEMPDPKNGSEFRQWLTNLRAEWEQSIDTTNLAWFQRPKLAAGAFSTLVWISARECAPPRPGEPLFEKWLNPDPDLPCFCVSGYCIGDSCLFHIRPGRTDSPFMPGTDLYRAIPLTDSKAFDLPPIVIGSKDLGRDSQMKFRRIEFIAQPGDLLVMATDAVSQWILRCYEETAYPRWDIFEELDETEWNRELDSMRADGEIRYDDSTLVILKLGTPAASGGGAVSAQNLASETEIGINPGAAARSAGGSEEFTEPAITMELEPGLVPDAHKDAEWDFEPQSEILPSAAPEEDMETVYEPESVPASESARNLEFTQTPEFTQVPEFTQNSEPESEFTAESEFPAEAKPAAEAESASESEPDFPSRMRSERILNSVHESTPRPGFSFRMASSAVPHAPSAAPHAPSAHSKSASGTSAERPAAERPAVSPSVKPGVKPSVKPQRDSSVPEDDGDQSERLAENWQQLRESSKQIAGILGDQLSEGMSRLGTGVNRVGSQLNEGVSRLGEAAKPRIQSMGQRLAGLFRHHDDDAAKKAQEEAQKKEEDSRPPARVIDPNRRRFYNPPPKD